MAGHSKWKNIRLHKGAQDAKRGKIFTKLIREITVAARTKGADPASNPRLRHAIEKALDQNMSKDNIERAIKRGTGELDGASYEEVRYEGYGPSGVAVIVDCQTDNRTRTVSEVRHAFTKHGGNLGTDGSVAYLFKTTGVILLPKGANEEKVLETALEAGANDVVTEADGSIEVLTNQESLAAVREALNQAGLRPASAEITERPTTIMPLAVEDAERVLKLLEVLEDLDDVHSVYTNADFPESLLARAG